MKKTIKNIFGFKAFSVLLSLSLLLGALWCVPAFAEEGTTAEVWDGTAATEFDGGDGTEANPYKISNGGQLYTMVKSGGNSAYYEITEDIYLNDISNEYTNDWVDKIYDSDSYRFLGTVDGKGHTIYGLYSNNGNKNRIGLFPYLGAGSTVKNIRISNAKLTTTVNGTVLMGAIAGQIGGTNVTISNCLVDSAELAANTTGSTVGGLIGNTAGNVISITNCGFSGTLKKAGAETYAGGIVANTGTGTVNATISNSYSIGAFPVEAPNATNIQGYKCQKLYSDKTSDCITGYTSYPDWLKTRVTAYATVLSADEMTGANAKVKMTAFDFYTTWQAVENGYPVPRTTDCADYTGEGTKENPYVISTDAQLYALVNDTETSDNYYELANDIVLNFTDTDDWYNTASQWVTAGDYTTTVFRGNLNGNNHTVSGLYVNTSGDANKYAGLFPVIGAGAVISNLTVEDAYLKGSNTAGEYYFGVIAGSVNLSASDAADASNLMKYPTIVACGVNNATVNARFAGGILGGVNGKARIESSYSANLTLSNDAYTGTSTNKSMNGIIGKSYIASTFFVKNCYTTYSSPYASDGSVVASNVVPGVKVTENETTAIPTGIMGGTFMTVENSVPVPSTAVNFIKVDTTGDEASLSAIRDYLLGGRTNYIVDVNNDVTFDICDLVYAALGE